MATIVKRNRILGEGDDVFSQNAWDHSEWTDEMFSEAKERIKQQQEESERLGPSIEEVEPRVTEKWDDFYKTHGDKFFKDRQWIFSEFPEILESLKPDSLPTRLFEVGCGVGNAVAHIIGCNQNPNLQIFCCDLSQKAIVTLIGRELYKKNSDRITAFQANITTDFHDHISKRIQPQSLDFITLVFTLSALKPESMQNAINNLATLLKPGGMLLFRDYAQYDLTQLRFKGKSYLRENYYVRADGTTSYFFTLDFLQKLFSKAGLIQVELKSDNRLLVNRLKSLKMCRCWLQAKYKKP